MALAQLTDSNTQLNKDIASVNANVALYQQQLINEFTARYGERRSSNVNSLLSSLNANSAVRRRKPRT